jgi:glycosyltransferase involved in cell wall biosynthesis
MKKVLFLFKKGSEKGGPTISHQRFINSSLSKEFSFHILFIPYGPFNLSMLIGIPKLLKQIKKIKPDIIHLIGLEMIGFYCAILAFLYRKAFILIGIHGSSEESLILKERPFKLFLLKIFQFITLILIDKFYTVSDYVNNLNPLPKFRSKNLGIISNIISTPKFKVITNFNPNKRKFNIISVGRIEKEKGFELLKDIIKENKYARIDFWIVGEGSYLNEMKTMLQGFNNVHFTGFLDYPSVLMEKVDLFLTTSLHETFGMAIAEAGIIGLPLIGPSIGGIPEIIKDNHNGYLIKNNLIESYLNKIYKLYKNPELLKQMGKHSKYYLSHKYNEKKITDKLRNVYNSIK